MCRSPRSTTTAAVNKPDRPIPVVRRAEAPTPGAIWLDAVIGLVMLGPMGLLSSLPPEVNRLLLWPEPTSEGVWRF
jgi:hypothetical protein